MRNGNSKRLARRVFACGVSFAAMILPFANLPVAKEAPATLSVVWSFPHQGVARFCYDRELAVAYFRYDIARKTTSIIKKEINGNESVIAEFPENPDEPSLSCSDDGQTIAALNGTLDGATLFLSKGQNSALYKFSDFYPTSFPGINSLLSQDGKSIALPELPQLVAGEDLLKRMRVFIFPKHMRDDFFVGDNLYIEAELSIKSLQFVGNEWKKQSERPVPPPFGVNEIARCGERDVVSLQDDVAEKDVYTVLDDPAPPSRDWLAQIGVRKVLQTYRDVAIYSRYGRCAFPLYVRTVRPWMASGLARFDAGGLSLFSFEQSVVPLSDQEVSFSKDGCYALVHAFRVLLTVPQFTMPQEVQLLSVPPDQCHR